MYRNLAFTIVLSIVTYIMLPSLSKAQQLRIGDRIEGRIVKIQDGDTYTLLLEDKEQIRIRMNGIDAPEGGMPYYNVAKEHLIQLAAGERVTVEITDIDGFGRYIAYTHLNDSIELSAEMIKAGMAWHYKQFNDSQELAQLELKARMEERGLWEEVDPVPPWIIRRLRRTRISTKELLVYRQRKLDVSQEKTELVDRGLKVKIDKEYGILKVSGKEGNTQEIRLARLEEIEQVILADYNMDGNTDLSICYKDGEKQYYLFDLESKRLEYHPEWQLHIWKLNTARKELLSYPVGDLYSGKIRLYQLDIYGNPEQIREVKYYMN